MEIVSCEKSALMIYEHQLSWNVFSIASEVWEPRPSGLRRPSVAATALWIHEAAFSIVDPKLHHRCGLPPHSKFLCYDDRDDC